MQSTQAPITMVVARMTVWRYKSGQREKALETLQEVMSTEMSGFRGDVVLLSSEDPDSEVIITFWEDEEAMKASAGEIFREQGGFKGVFREMEQFLSGPPEVKNFRVHSAEVERVTPEIAKPI
jgi:heme-degrading monooxygenase HmoA